MRGRAAARGGGALALVALVAIAAPLRGAGAEVALPIRLDEAFLERAFAEQVFGGTQEPLVLSRSDGCGRVTATPLGLSAEPGGLRIRTQVRGRLGVPLGGLCWLTTDVEGELEVLEVPELQAERPVVRFRVRDSRWTPTREQPFWMPGERAYPLVRELVHPRLERFALDLSRPVDELRGALLLFWSPAHRDAAVRMADSLSLAALEPRDGALVLTLQFEAPDAPAPPQRAEPAFTAEEVAAFEAAWQRWDAFLGFVVKSVGAEALRAEQRLALADVLLDARHDLVIVLASPPGVDDPVPDLFVATWERLAPVLRELQTGLPGETALRYLALVAAGDAVKALHDLAPAGIELSADGLRRLARLVAPTATRDPLLYSVEVDAELRTLLGFGPPIPVPELPPGRPPIVAPGPRPAPPGSAGPPWPPLDVPRSPRPPPPAAPDAGAPSPSSHWLRLGRRIGRALARLIAAPAHAQGADEAEAAPPAVPDATSIELQGWAPSREDVQEYLALAGDLLRGTAATVATDGELPPPWPERFVPLVLATGWQESCWRQWVQKGGAVVPLRSGAGAVGILQVNVHVWRGLYDREALNRSIGYNARAGAEILRHYLRDYALQRLDAAEVADVDLVARVTYALYHGGPRHLRRPIEGGRTASLRAVDAAFLEKYEAVRDGRAEEAVAACY